MVYGKIMISTLNVDGMVNNVLAFGFMVAQFIRTFLKYAGSKRPVIAHFHEWMGGTALPELRREKLPIATVFTTHATVLGRHLAIHDPWFYEHLPSYNWRQEARRFNIETEVLL